MSFFNLLLIPETNKKVEDRRKGEGGRGIEKKRRRGMKRGRGEGGGERGGWRWKEEGEGGGGSNMI